MSLIVRICTIVKPATATWLWEATAYVAASSEIRNAEPPKRIPLELQLPARHHPLKLYSPIGTSFRPCKVYQTS